MRGEVLDQLDLLVGERAHLLAIHANRANEFTFLQHWHYHIGSHACDFDKVNQAVVFSDVGLIGPQVGDVNRLPGLSEAVERDSRIVSQVDHGPAPQNIGVAFLALNRDSTKDRSFAQEQIAERGLTDPGCV